MLFKTIATLLAIAGLASAQTELKHGEAHIQQKGIDAVFTFDKVATGVNVTITVIKGLNTTTQVLPEGFDYHIHVKPIGADGDCMATGGHLDPTNVGAPPCNPKNLTSCQIGDLSGKHGNLTADVKSLSGAIATISYIDTQLSFTGEGAITGRSVVIHNNFTRLACANLIVDGYTAPSPSGGSGSGTLTGNPSATNKPSSAVKLVGSVALTGLVAMMMMAL
ncbi:hypothetical protein BGZ65_004470 [Modicella reniformis]|uniref:Superoxide dismutase copper/zinc binding domain-containing protein n=1 Tax=Modicella reniformis TaxID=1440133 RepID=A0A9P6IKT8_9FUNG|nr:hypothetical protein BGZ65_004470 [Modicella reniformis]